MITLISGTPGSGKSAVAVDMGLAHVLAGGVVVSNFSLVPDWHEQFARRHICSRFSRRLFRARASAYRDRWWSFRTIDDLWSFAGSCGYNDYLGRKMRKQFEGRCLIIIDEAQLIFNPRMWRENFGWIEFFSQHRKLGYDVLLIAHDDSMIDSQCRSFVEVIIRLRNLRHVRLPIPFIDISLNWLFLSRNVVHARWLYYGASVLGGTSLKNRFHRLELWKLRLYDSLRLFRADNSTGEKSLARFGADPLAQHTHAVCTLAGEMSGAVLELRASQRTAAGT